MTAMTATAAALWLLAFLFLWRVPLCRGGRRPSTGSVSFIVPARNEERTLPGLLRSLGMGGSDAPAQVIVVDDQSQDATAEVARRFGATVIASQEPPDGWLGKAWACWQGAQEACGDTLVFLDADTALDPGGVEALRGCHVDGGDGLVAFWPYHRMRRLYERLAAFFNIIIVASMNVTTVLGDRLRPLGAFGPCIICRRRTYMEIGGHRSVRSHILDDVALGRKFLEAGRPVRLYGGRGVISFRMYPDGLRSLLTGFTKNMGSGMGSGSPLITLLFVGWLTGAYITTFYLVRSLILWAPPEPVVWLALYGLFALQVHWMLRRLGNYTALTAALFPLPLVFFSGVAAASLFMTYVLREVRWKGRRIVFPGGGRGE